MGITVRKTLENLGYTDVPGAFRGAAQDVPRLHPYALEMRKVFDAGRVLPNGASVLGVYEVDGVPAVCLVEGHPEHGSLEAFRQRLWNQGLVSLVLIVGDEAVQALSVLPNAASAAPIQAREATRESPYSAYGVASGALKQAHASWFSAEARVDGDLLRNLDLAIAALRKANAGFELADAQYLMGQVMFVAYLEHRGLITAALRKEHGLTAFSTLLATQDRAGMDHLLEVLKDRFNGDFISPKESRASWTNYPDCVFEILSRFLAREDLERKQLSVWPYDFSQIPVELLSGVYETFLGERQKKDAAYYTPRHLAKLAIDELFHGVERPDLETVWDAACGSGILLTTAFRRMLASAEQAKGKSLTFAERTKLLQARIFGGDINLSACRVTAFSLYLCLLEDLPTQHGVSMRLPHLLNENIFTPESHGDAFSPEHPILTGKAPRPTCVVSNPPWREPDEKNDQSADLWAKAHGADESLRQIALIYAQLVTTLAKEGARIVLILPGGAFVRSQHHGFVRKWLSEVRLERLINFSDLRNVLFPGAKHPCVVAVAINTPPESGVPLLFDYVTPKADAALLYNRLTIHAADRRRVEQSRVRLNSDLLRSLYWCSELELADIAKLRIQGTLGSLKRADKLISGTGFHVTDRAKIAPIAPGWLAKMPHLPATGLPSFGPNLFDGCVTSWPSKYKEVASQGRRELYEGPRVVVPNGMTPSHRIRAFAIETPASVTNSCSVLRFTDPDPDLACFLAAYLSSRLAAYLAMIFAPSAVMERTQIKLGELYALPFILPEDHADPLRAAKWVRDIAQQVRTSEEFVLSSGEHDLPPRIERLIRDYFGVSQTLGHIIDETAEQVLPNMQPTTISKLPGPLQAAPSAQQMAHYAHALAAELINSRDTLGGRGGFHVSLTSWSPGSMGGLGMVKISVEPDAQESRVEVDTTIAKKVLADLHKHGLLDSVMSGGMSQAPDTLIRQRNVIYFAKPLVNRLWLTSAALDDALRIVRHVQRTAA